MEWDKILFLAILASPILLWAWEWIKLRVGFYLDVMGLTMAQERCKSLSSITGECDWGDDCLCWHTHMQNHQKSLEGGNTVDMFEAYPPSGTSVPASGPKTLVEAKKAIKAVIEEGTHYDYSDWWEKQNPGLVPEGTQPVESEEEQLPGFSKFGG